MSAFLMENKKLLLDGSVIACVEQRDGEWEDTFICMGENMWLWNRTFTVTDARESWDDFPMEFILQGEVAFYMIPGVNYNGNFWGEGKEPKGLLDDGIPWRFAGHRSGVRAGMFAQTKEAAVGIFVAQENPMGCSMEMERAEKKGFCMRLHFPEQEGPRVYCARDSYEAGKYMETTCFCKKNLVFSAWIVVREPQKQHDYAAFLDKAWEVCREEGSVRLLTDEQVWELGMDFAKNRLYFEEDGFAGFCMGLTWKDKGWEQKRDYLEIGWVGQNASLAVSLLYEYAIFGEKEALRRGLSVLDVWCGRAALPNGLFRCRFDQIRKWGGRIDNDEERNDAANLYSAVTELLEAYHLLAELGIERKLYRKTALAICSFVTQHQLESGKMAKAWFNDGRISDAEGTVGCYLAEALCFGWKECKSREFLNAARAGFSYYYKEFEKYGYTTAGALDTCCVDKESAIPLLRCALELFEITGEREYLEAAKQVSSYLASWQYHYNVQYGGHTLLGQMGYRTRGGTSVSVQHHHIDCYGLEFYEAWKKLAKYTGKEIWRERAEALWENALQNISDGTLVIKGQKRPRGSQDEGILQTRWHTKRGEYFGVSEWLVAWNTAFRLKILRKDFQARKREKSKEEKRIS